MSFIRRVLVFILALLLYALTQIPMTVAAFMVGAELSLSPLMTAGIALCQILTLALFAWFGKKQGLISFDKTWIAKPAAKVVGLGLVAILTFSFLGTFLLQFEGIDTTANQYLIQSLFGIFPKSLMFMVLVPQAALTEEIICRGLIPEFFPKKLAILGHLVGTLVFAALHMPTGIISWFIYGGMGAVLAYIRYRTGKLEYSILVHALNNLLSFLGMLFV